MVRGHAKEVAQQKNAAKLASKEASKGRDGAEVRISLSVHFPCYLYSKKKFFILKQSKKIKEAGITYVCSVCKQGMSNIGVLRTHFENRHPKSPLPPELQTPSA